MRGRRISSGAVPSPPPSSPPSAPGRPRSPAHRGFVRWLRTRLREIPGLAIRHDGYPIRRQLERAGPFALELTDGSRRPGDDGPLVHVPPGQAMASAGVAGRIVVRALVATAALSDAARAAPIAHDLRRAGMISLAMIAGPWPLFDPALGTETVDPDGLRRMARAFRDVIVDLQEVPRAVLWEGGTCHPPAE